MLSVKYVIPLSIIGVHIPDKVPQREATRDYRNRL